MASEKKKSNTELLKDIQNIVDEYNEKKQEIMVMLDILDKLEIKYYNLTEQVRNKK